MILRLVALLGASGPADSEKRNDAKWRKVEPYSVFFYDGGSWVLLHGEKCLPNDLFESMGPGEGEDQMRNHPK